MAEMLPEILSLSSPCPALSNVLFNHVLPDSMSLPWAQATLIQLRNLVHPVAPGLCNLEDLQEKYHIPKQLFLFYLEN